MPFRSESQRRWMYAAESRGDVPPGTSERWQAHTPKDKKLPERVSMEEKAFFAGFKKRAQNETLGRPGSPAPAESAQQSKVPGEGMGEKVPVAAEAAPALGGQAPVAPEKLLKWNPQGGVDPRSPEEMATAQAVDLITLPEGCEGASCGSCKFFRNLDAGLGTGFCTHPEVKLDVTSQMCCNNWDAPGTYRAWEAVDPSLVPNAGILGEAGALDSAVAMAGAGPGAAGMPPAAGDAGAAGEPTTPADQVGMGAAGAPEAEKKPEKKEPKEKKDEKGPGGQTVHVHVGGAEKKAFWRGFGL